MRKNRTDPKNPVHAKVLANPKAYTRASRRAAGHRGGVHVDAMRAFYAANQVLPRAVRRLMREPLKAQKRMAHNRARVNAALARYGVQV